MQGQLLLRRQRGEVLEAEHEARAIVTAADGSIIAGCGDVDAPVPLLACGHPLQTVGLLARVASLPTVSEAALALAAGQNRGSEEQCTTLRTFLSDLGFGHEKLQCGPLGLRHGCAGFHAFLLAVNRSLGGEAASYRESESTIQRTLLDELLRLTRSLRTEVCTVLDECGLPSLALPLREVAALYAGLADTAHLPPTHAAAAGRLRAALRSHHGLFAPSGYLEGDLYEATEGDLLVRVGENGLIAAVAADRGWGMALQTRDANPAVAETLFLALIDKLGIVPGGRAATLLETQRSWRNRRGDRCGTAKTIVELSRPRARQPV